MPNRKVHVNFGLAVAATTSILTMEETLSTEQKILRLLGTLIGGYWGARMPDIIDPSSLGPNHRSVGHAILPSAGSVGLLKDSYKSLRQSMLKKDGSDGVQNNFLVGAMDGFVSAYASHLFLDSFTPKGLPLLK